MIKTQAYQFIIEAAKAGGAKVKELFGQEIEHIEKTNAADFVTAADLASEKAVLEILNAHFPGYNIVAEESGKTDNGSEFTFYIDPLDGTNNFGTGIAYFSTMIALMKGEETVFAVVCNPITNECFYAEKGCGAYLNGMKLQVSDEKNVNRMNVALIPSYDFSRAQAVKFLELTFVKGFKRQFSNWSAGMDMSLMAAGKLHCIVSSMKPLFDFLPGKLIAAEAGALVVGFDGKEVADSNGDFILACNKEALTEVKQLFDEVRKLA